MALAELPEVKYGGSCALEATTAYEILMQRSSESLPEEVAFQPNPSYEEYLALHKVVLDRDAASSLVDLHENLKGEYMPRYLGAAGWAAAEAALIGDNLATSQRTDLLSGALDCWERAMIVQKLFNASGSTLTEAAYPYRIALDMAVVPLLGSYVMRGEVPLGVRLAVFEDCLNIAQANVVRLELMAREGDIEGLGEHIGLGYECNALLAFNLRCTKGWFAIPSSARSDTGYYHREQTHDLSIVHLKKGQLKTITPVEIKSSTSTKDRARYKALLVRGKMHLSAPGYYTPGHTLQALEAVYEGRDTVRERHIVSQVSERMLGMVRDYNMGEVLGHITTQRTVTRFHDNEQVARNHPGWPSAS